MRSDMYIRPCLSISLKTIELSRQSNNSLSTSTSVNKMHNSLLKWELDWVDQNVNRYDSSTHAESVKKNIEKRYLINELNNKILKLESKLKDMSM